MSASTSDWEPPSPELLQRMLPQYEITAILGRGGMGAVYKGRQVNLDREVAIKVLPETFTKGDDELNFAARFKQEARAMAKLDHPAIISVYDFGETPDGQLYFIMEFIDGMDIHQYLQHHGGKLPQEQALSIAAHVLDALEYAHSNGIVHRDIKPANILLNRDGRVKIADFGLAKKLEEAGGDSVPALTMTNVAVGTPDYVAPEALDSDQKPDHRADLYAVGVMLYQMLTGKLPRGQFKSPSALDSAIDPRLDAIVSKALQPHPDDRYSSAATVRVDLDVIFSQPFAKVVAGADSAVVAAVVPVTTSVKGKPAAKAGKSGKGGNYTPVVVERSKLPVYLGIGATCAMLLGLLLIAKKEKPGAEPPAATPTASAKTQPSTPAAPKAPVAVNEKSSDKAKAAPAKTEAPKPAATAFPPGRWVKVFSKVEDLPASIQQQINPKNWDGWIPPQLINLPQELKRNYSVRARFRAAATPQEKSYISVRREHSDSVASLMTTGAEIVGQVRSASGIKYFLDAKNSKTVPAKGDYQVEFAVVGSQFVARLHPSVFRSAKADCPSEGPSRIDAKSAVRDIEVMNLDGLPEVEALKLLGVDGDGRSLAPQPGPTAPSPPTTVTDPGKTASPPGQWVKLNYEDFHEGIRSKLKVEDGWMSPILKPCSIIFPSDLIFSTNQGIRVRCKLSPDSPLIPEFKLRSSKSDCLALSRSFRTLTDKISHSGTVSAVLATGQFEWVGQPSEVVVEFAAVNERVFARFDGRLSLVASDGRPEKGGVAIWNAQGPFRDIEVINLDGLPEAEALRLLGVDENGKDLRATTMQVPKPEAETDKTAEAMDSIPELKALHDQFLTLEQTRVTAPFEAEVTKLNTGYLGGLDRAIADEKRAGHLDGVLAIEQEKTRVAAGEAVPKTDEDSTPESLKKLRGIYREAHAKLEATRVANRLALTGPLANRLKQIEADLTRQDRIEHAKAVRQYREALESPAAEPKAPETVKAPSETVAPDGMKTERVRPDPKVSRAAAEYALGRGAEVIILSKEKVGTRFKPGSPLPDGDFELGAVYFPIGLGLEISDADLTAITRARELRIFSIGEGNHLIFQSLAPFRNAPSLTELIIQSYGTITAEDCEVVASILSLEKLEFGNSSDPVADLSRLLSPPNLEKLSLNGGRLRPGDGSILNQYPKLKALTIWDTETEGFLLDMGDMDQIELLSLSHTTVPAAHLEALHDNLGKTLVSLAFGSAKDDSSAAVDVAIRRFPKLEFLLLRGKISEEILLKLPSLKELTSLTLQQAEITPQSLQAISQCRELVSLTLGNGRLTGDDIAALRRLDSLKTLTLRDNGIQIDQALIPEFAKLDQLTQLDLPESQATEAQIKALREALPNCTISRAPRYQ
jgi:hypothetical protein